MVTLQTLIYYCMTCWFLLYNYFPCLLFAIPLDLERTNDITKHAHCTLKQSHFLKTAQRRNIFSLAKQARLIDKDTDTKIFGSYLFNDIEENDHCFLMSKVVGYVAKNVLLSGLFEDYAHIDDALGFLEDVDRDLESCKSENEEQVIKNVEIMKIKMEMLGLEGTNKAIGELDLLFGYLRKCAFHAQKNRLYK